MFFPVDPKKLEIEKALELKYKHIPNSLYKYKSFSSNNLEILNNDIIYLSDPKKFNDPYDCSLNMIANDLAKKAFKKNLKSMIARMDRESKFTNEDIMFLDQTENLSYDLSRLYAEKYPIETIDGSYVDPDEYGKISSQIIDKEFSNIYLDLMERWNKKENIFITCFSEIYDSILMWSHYANNHEGFCIEYNFTNPGIHPITTNLLFPVYYQENLFDASKFVEHMIINTPEQNRSINVEFNINMNIYAAIVKAKEWEYEKEWRYVFPYIISQDPMILRVPEPKAIYLGAKISNKNKNKAIEIAETRNFEVHQMELDSSKFSLNSTQII